MLEFDKIDISKGINTNKTNASKERDICHYWCFLSKKAKYEPYLCKGCHELRHKAVNFNDIAIVSAKGIDYRIHFWNISEDDSINIINYSNLNEKRGVLYFSITYKK